MRVVKLALDIECFQIAHLFAFKYCAVYCRPNVLSSNPPLYSMNGSEELRDLLYDVSDLDC